MKARIKATGEIVDLAPYTRVCEDSVKGRSWLVEELDDADDVPDYWARLKHTYVGMFMKSFLDNFDGTTSMEILADDAIKLAHALVEKMKEERK